MRWHRAPGPETLFLELQLGGIGLFRVASARLGRFLNSISFQVVDTPCWLSVFALGFRDHGPCRQRDHRFSSLSSWMTFVYGTGAEKFGLKK